MSSATQLRAITLKLRDYFNKVSLNLTSTGNALPSFEDYVADLIYDNIQTDAVQGSLRAASFSNGALADTVHLTAAIIREFGMRAKTRAMYYDDAESESGTMADYFDLLYGQYLNYYRGTSPEQGAD